MNPRPRRYVLAAIAGMYIGACTAHGPAPASPSAAPTAPPTATTGVPESPGGTTSLPPEPSPIATGGGEQLLGNLDPVTLLTPTSGSGRRPLLEWTPVAGADHYGAYLYAPSGAIYWAWSGRRTAIHVGGEPQLRDRAAGPSVSRGMTWAVIAYNADMLPIAASELRSISP